MLIEIHMIQNHSPANLNRDDLGAPKTCTFGGVQRLRISSQCLKRSIRRSALFQEALEKDGGVRTRRLIIELAKRCGKNIEKVANVFRKCGIKPVKDKKKNAKEPYNTNILLFLAESAINDMAEALKSEEDESKVAEKFKKIVGKAACVPDIALSGRMIELDQEGLFADLDLGVEAALSVAHAITTHQAINEVDYFTAVDDRNIRTTTYAKEAESDDEESTGKGAGHVDEAQYGSGCFYKYFCLDWDQLLSNIAPEPKKPEDKKDDSPEMTQWKESHTKWTDELKPSAEKLAAATLGCFLRAAARTAPSGKQNSHASYCEPCGILVEIKNKGKTPTSYANAFAEPVERIGKPDDDAADEKSIEGRSVACLADHVHSIRKAYGINSTLFWYSPKLWRFPLQYWERSDDGKKLTAKRVVDDPRRFDLLGGEKDKPAGLVEAVVKEVSKLEWDQVCDAGRKESQP